MRTHARTPPPLLKQGMSGPFGRPACKLSSSSSSSPESQKESCPFLALQVAAARPFARSHLSPWALNRIQERTFPSQRSRQRLPGELGFPHQGLEKFRGSSLIAKFAESHLEEAERIARTSPPSLRYPKASILDCQARNRQMLRVADARRGVCVCVCFLCHSILCGNKQTNKQTSKQTNPSPYINISRNISRLKDVFCSAFLPSAG